MIEKTFYVYAISVDGVIRYIGKGSNGRMHFHVIEAQRINRRRARGANTDVTSTTFYRKLAAALRRGATIRDAVLVNHLTEREAYRLEKEKIERLYTRKPSQLWNSVDERFIGITWKDFQEQRLAIISSRSGPVASRNSWR